MAGRIKALINPELLVWARKTAGLGLEEASAKADVKPERLEQWETGEQAPTLNQLRKLARAYRRPIAVFYLPKPPKDFQPLRDFRSLTPGTGRFQSPRLIFEMRRARNRLLIALDLFDALEESPPAFERTIRLDDDPDESARKIRELLGVTYETQTRLKTDYEALNMWRSALERVGVFVFHASGVDLEEMRGFSMTEGPLSTIVVNVKDAPRARIFTMIHELAHIMLKEGGLCDMREHPNTGSHEQQVEVFANRIAGAVLVPQEDLLSEDIVGKKGDSTWWEDDEIKRLSAKYMVSPEVLVRRLLICGLTTPDFYKSKRAEYAVRKGGKSGFAEPFRKVIGACGPMFVRLVLSGYYREHITAGDVSDFLDVKLKHLEKIEREVMGASAEFRAAS